MTDDTAASGLERLLTTQELADYLSLPIKTLYEWRSSGQGPKAVKVGKQLRYPESGVRAWLAELAG